MVAVLGRLATRRFFHHPIFVVGLGRSGTTVLLGSLGKHPHILQMRSEVPFISHIATIPYLYEFGDNRDYYLRALRVPKKYLYENLRRLCFEAGAGRNYGLKTLAISVVRRDRFILSKRYWCAKTFPDFEACRALIKLFPEAKFIYIVRNGCDVVQSRARFHGFSHLSFREQCDAWAQSVEKYRYLGTLESAFQVRQERLAAEPNLVFTELFDWIGLKAADGPADFVRRTLLHPLDKATQENVDVKEILRAREPAYIRWSDDQRQMFKEICAGAMREAGYEMPF
jgi:hypothetical protein